MLGYIIRRLIAMIPVLFALTIFTFFLVRLVPGNPASGHARSAGNPGIDRRDRAIPGTR